MYKRQIVYNNYQNKNVYIELHFRNSKFSKPNICMIRMKAVSYTHLTSYHLGAGMEAFRRGQELSYYHRDEQLSTVFVTDGQGEIRNLSLIHISAGYA